jgi:aryl-phospho-beta-D-glucosidase BglC (GH1 family)
MGQLPKAQDIVSKMKVGWNMGNTLEAICGETAWGGAITTQKLIDSVKAAGFNAIRLPCAWFCHSDTNTSEINTDWIARVKEVADYCVNDSLYVIINIHWDNGWLENRVDVKDSAQVIKRQRTYWTQIANYFKDYDEHLLFASANEPNVSDATGMSVLLSYHQTFINAVRATGGNNSSRTLIIQGPSTDIDKTNQLMNTMPTDQIANRLIVEVHYYTPYQFCLMSADASWGKMFYYWGKGNHSATDVTRNSTWGEESDVENFFGEMKTKFVDKGIPVIIGEFSAMKRKLSPPSDQALHIASVEYYYKYIVKSSVNKGIIPFCWDTPGGIFNRSTGDIINRDIVDAIIQGVRDTVSTGITSVNSALELYPNPFSSTFNLKAGNTDEILRISIFDMLGRQIETIEHSAIKSSLTIGSSLKSNIYIVQVYGLSWAKSFKVIKV